jgi:PKHD-type hydroxylase
MKVEFVKSFLGSSTSLSIAPYDDGYPYYNPHNIAVNPASAQPIVLPTALEPEECSRIVRFGSRLSEAKAVALGDEGRAVARRNGKIAWIEPGPESYWLYEKIEALVHRANETYGFELIGFAEAFQFSVYERDHYFGWHTDVGLDQSAARKLSLTIQLSAPDTYSGGQLEFVGSSAPPPAATELGCAIAFPSYLAHRVSKVTSGLRYSMVVWAYGPPFR